MKEEDYRQLKMEQSGMEIILKFPNNAEDEEHIKSEVKEMLSNICQEYLAHICSL